MKTGTIQIGNSDDKLTQYRWAEFMVVTFAVVTHRCEQVHFAGNSAPTAPWQNYCLVFTLEDEDMILLKEDLEELRKDFNQESIALTIGETEFVK